jgi:hypothetical protein
MSWMLPAAVAGLLATRAAGLECGQGSCDAVDARAMLQKRMRVELGSEGDVWVQPGAAATPTTGPSPLYQNSMHVPVSQFGIWDRGSVTTPDTHPFVRGYGNQISWSIMEPTNGTFDFSIIDKSLTLAASTGRGFYFMVNAGPSSPDWIYSEVPKVMTAISSAETKATIYPYYLDAAYKKYFHRMIAALGQFIRGHKLASVVSFYQANFGSTGDIVLYKGTPLNPAYIIDDDHMRDFMFETWVKYAAAMQQGPGRVIPILVNLDAGEPVPQDFAIRTFSPLGIKGFAISRGHHLSGELSFIQNFQPMMLNPTAASKYLFVFSRAEMDDTWLQSYYSLNVKLMFYWGVINALNGGLAVFDITSSALLGCYQYGFNDTFLFFNKYAPQIWPHNATSAFIALHRGLDAYDLVSFPETKFGRQGKSLSRVSAICAAYGEYGCKVDDTTAVFLGQVYQRQYQAGFNDVGYDIWRTNYGRWLEQVDADETSQGLFRIGGELTTTSSKYARFARGLVHARNKTGMYFRLAEGFFSAIPVGPLNLRVVWYDGTRGTWQLEYRAAGGAVKVAWRQACAGDGQWKEASFQISDGAMDHGHTRGSDFAIVSMDRTDAIFHMLEVDRV